MKNAAKNITKITLLTIALAIIATAIYTVFVLSQDSAKIEQNGNTFDFTPYYGTENKIQFVVAENCDGISYITTDSTVEIVHGTEDSNCNVTAQFVEKTSDYTIWTIIEIARPTVEKTETNDSNGMNLLYETFKD